MKPATRWHWNDPPVPGGSFHSILDDPPAERPEPGALARGRLAVTHDNDVELLVGGHEVLPRLLEAIARAEQSIHLEVMLFFNDEAGYQIRDALLRRLDECGGRLQVRVLYDYLATTLGDPFLSKGTNPLRVSSFMAPLRGAGAEVVDSSFVGDQDPARLQHLSNFIPADLHRSILNFPYEVQRAYRWVNATVVRVLGEPSLQRPVQRFLKWCERHESAMAEQLTPHRLISRYAIHDHRKIFIFDGKEAYCGGMNVGQEYLYRHPFDPTTPAGDEIERLGNPEPWAKWHDTCCALRGPVVNRLQALFLGHFQRCGGAPPTGHDLERCFPPPVTLTADMAARSGGMKVGVATTTPGRPSELEREALAMLLNAQHRVLLRNPYTVRPSFIGALGDAATRGVAVRALLPDDHNDSVLHRGLMRSWYPHLWHSGVEIREYQHHFSHTKALTVDGRRTLLGSFNYNNRSSVLDFECGIVIDDESFAAETERRLYDEDRDAGLAHETPRRRSWTQAAEMAASLAVFELWATFL